MKLDQLANHRVVIAGFGREGQSTYRFLKRRWPRLRVSILDDRGADAAASDSELKTMLNAEPHVTWHPVSDETFEFVANDVLIKSPGIPWTRPAIRTALSRQVPVTSHLDILLSNYPREKVVAVTGTKGKSTTTSLIASICAEHGMPAKAVGNIGVPPLDVVSLDAPVETLVCEVSSHQLTAVNSSAARAVLLAIYPEHLDYYASMDDYVAAKARITSFQQPSDFLVYNADNALATAVASQSRATRLGCSRSAVREAFCAVVEGAIVCRQGSVRADILNVSDIPLRGPANVDNVLAAVAIARTFGISADTIGRAVRSFKPLPHRLTPVGTFRGISFVDDSIATVPEAAIAALDALGPHVETLIAGGHERSLAYDALAREVVARGVRTVIAFPPAGDRLLDAIREAQRAARSTGVRLLRVTTMEEAVRLAYEHTRPGSIVLLSPAAASYGTFHDFAHRGDLFKKYVEQQGHK